MSKGLSQQAIKILLNRVERWAKKRYREAEINAREAAHATYVNHYEQHTLFDEDKCAVQIPVTPKILKELAREGKPLTISIRSNNSNIPSLDTNGLAIIDKLRKAHNLPSIHDITLLKNVDTSEGLIKCLVSDAEAVRTMVTEIENAVLAGNGIDVANKIDKLMEGK